MKSLRDFIDLLGEKKKVLSDHMNVAQERLKKIEYQIIECQEMILSWKQTMLSSHKLEETSRDYVYRNTQNQGQALYKQQILEQKLIQLKLEKLAENNMINQYKKEILKTDRGYRRLSLCISRQKQKKLLEHNVSSEDKIMKQN